MKTGKPVWDTKLVDSEKLTVGFTGAPLVVKDKVIIGAQGGEWPWRGPIFGVDGATGEKKWEFFTVAGTEEAKKTWGGESWRTGGGGGWMAGAYNPSTEPRLLGYRRTRPRSTTGPATSGRREGPRPGDNLYTSSVIGLDPDTGELKTYFQELPHDAWDFDSAVGEFVQLERDGKNYVVHPNKGGYVYVYDEQAELPERVAAGQEHQLHPGRRQERQAHRPARHGRGQAHQSLPGDRAAASAGTAAPTTRRPASTTRSARNGAWTSRSSRRRRSSSRWRSSTSAPTSRFTHPEGGKAYGHVERARPDHRRRRAGGSTSPSRRWHPCSRPAGNLLFVPDSRGVLHAYDARNGAELWSHNNGLGHNGGIISYSAEGKQYVTVAVGWGSLVGDEFAKLFGEPYTEHGDGPGLPRHLRAALSRRGTGTA